MTKFSNLNMPLLSKSLKLTTLFLLLLFITNFVTVSNEYNVILENYQKNNDEFDIRWEWGSQSGIPIGHLPANLNYSTIKEDFLHLTPDLDSGEIIWCLSPHNSFNWMNTSAFNPIGYVFQKFDILWVSNYSTLFYEWKNEINLIAGHFPQNFSEIIVDSRFYDERNVGQKITLYPDYPNFDENYKESFAISGIYNISNTRILEEMLKEPASSKFITHYDRPIIFAHIDFGIKLLNNFSISYEPEDHLTHTIPMTIKIFFKVSSPISSINQLHDIENDIQKLDQMILSLNMHDYFFTGSIGKLVNALVDLNKFNQILSRLFLWNILPILNFEILFLIFLRRIFKNRKDILQKQLVFGLDSSNLKKKVLNTFLIKSSIYFGSLMVLEICLIISFGFKTMIVGNLIISCVLTAIFIQFISYLNIRYTLSRIIRSLQHDYTTEFFSSDEQDFISYIKTKQTRKRFIISAFFVIYLTGFLMLMWNRNLRTMDFVFLPYDTALISFFLPQWVFGLYLLCILSVVMLYPLYKLISLKIQILLWKIQKNELGLWLFPKISQNNKAIKSSTFIITMVLCFNILFSGSFVNYFHQSKLNKEELLWDDFNLKCELNDLNLKNEPFQAFQQKISSLATMLNSTQTIQIAFSSTLSYGRVAFLDPIEYYSSISKYLIKISPSNKILKELDYSDNNCLVSKELANKEGFSIGDQISLFISDHEHVFSIIGIIERAPLLNIDEKPEEVHIVLPLNLNFKNEISSYYAFFKLPSSFNLRNLDYNFYTLKYSLVKSISIRNMYSYDDLPFFIRFLNINNILNFFCLVLLWWNNGFDYYSLRSKEFDNLLCFGYSKKKLKRSVLTEMFADNFSIFLMYFIIFGIILIFIRQIFVLFFSWDYAWPKYFTLGELDAYYEKNIYIHQTNLGNSAFISYSIPLEFFQILILLGAISFLFSLKKYPYKFDKNTKTGVLQ